MMTYHRKFEAQQFVNSGWCWCVTFTSSDSISEIMPSSKTYAYNDNYKNTFLLDFETKLYEFAQVVVH